MFTTQFKALILILVVVGILGLVVMSQVVLNKRLSVVQERLDMLTSIKVVPILTPSPTATPTAALKLTPSVKVATPPAVVK